MFPGLPRWAEVSCYLPESKALSQLQRGGCEGLYGPKESGLDGIVGRAAEREYA